jgi:hypothetical protein
MGYKLIINLLSLSWNANIATIFTMPKLNICLYETSCHKVISKAKKKSTQQKVSYFSEPQGASPKVAHNYHQSTTKLLPKTPQSPTKVAKPSRFFHFLERLATRVGL